MVAGGSKRLVKEQQLRRRQRHSFIHMQGAIAVIWWRYANNEINASRLLIACGRIYGNNLR
jgi:hypothetical protein